MAESRIPPINIKSLAVSTPVSHFLCRPEPMIAYTALGPASVLNPTAVLSKSVWKARCSDSNISAEEADEAC